MCYDSHVSIGFDYLAFFEFFVFSYRSNFKNMCFSVVIRVTKRVAKQKMAAYEVFLRVTISPRYRSSGTPDLCPCDREHANITAEIL